MEIKREPNNRLKPRGRDVERHELLLERREDHRVKIIINNR